MRDFPNGAVRGREAKQDPLSSPECGSPKRNRFYALRAKDQIWMMMMFLSSCIFLFGLMLSFKVFSRKFLM